MTISFYIYILLRILILNKYDYIVFVRSQEDIQQDIQQDIDETIDALEEMEAWEQDLWLAERDGS